MISKAGRWKTKGFTLIELLVALGVVGLIMGLVIGQFSKLTRRELKSSASRLASTIRYLYNKSVSEGVALRLVLDLDESKYWVEGTTESFTLAKEEEEFFEKRERKTENPEPRTPNPEQKEAETSIKPKEATFAPQESYLLKSVQFPKGVFFKDVFAEHQIDKLEKGQAFIYFFPRGYVERSIIHLRDAEDKTHYALEVNPITGAVAISLGYKELEIER